MYLYFLLLYFYIRHFSSCLLYDLLLKEFSLVEPNSDYSFIIPKDLMMILGLPTYVGILLL